MRTSTLVEADREYVQAARIIGVWSSRITRWHILPNVMMSVFVTATLNRDVVLLAEATLSFLGVGLPSLGTMFRAGDDCFFSVSWWVVPFPDLRLCFVIFCTNLAADWLRDAPTPISAEALR